MRFLFAAVSAATLLMSVNAAQADKRVAFVVGNGAYKNVAALPNPSIDAKSMAKLLRNVGFDVVEGSNLTRDKMTEKLLDFGKKAEGADVALFFYAGHGIAVNGTNYLLPVDADLKSEMDVKLGAAINVDLTLEQTMSDAKVKLVFLDACRDNPFAAKIRSAKATRSVNVQTGLAEMKSGEGTLIAFATGPGQTALDGEVGTNSPFTRALMANITSPGVEIQQAMTKVRAQVNEETAKGQLPWGHTNLIGPVYLNGAPAASGGAPETPNTPAVVAAPASEVELEFWRSIKDSNKPEELNAYLTNYPNGTFKSIALARIASLQDGPSTSSLPSNVSTMVESFHGRMSPKKLGDPQIAYRVAFVPKLANRASTADEAIEFIKVDAEATVALNQVLFKETEKKKFGAKQIVSIMQSEGFTKFNLHRNSELWRLLDGKNPTMGYGVEILGGVWCWYDTWLVKVRQHCESNAALYGKVDENV